MADDAKKPAALPPGIQAVGASGSLGVDIQGLSALAGTLYGYVPATQNVVSEIDRRVRTLLSDAGWKGKDATEFGDAWGEDSHEARKLSMLEEDAGGVIDTLASSLADLQVRLNDWLEEADSRLQQYDDTQLVERKKVNDAKKEALETAKEQSEKLQKEAAGKLIALYSPKQGWSLLGALNKHDSDKKLSEGFRDKLEDVKDDLDGAIPKDFWNQDAALDWGSTGAIVLGASGVIIGGIAGATAGAPAGGVGAVPGGIAGAFAGAATISAPFAAVGGIGGFVLGGLFG